MKLDKLRSKSVPQPMIIPLVDIIFFLLVFFMISTIYMVEQKTIPINLPAVSTAQTEDTKQIPLTLTAAGEIYLEQEEIPLPYLASHIQKNLKENPDTAFVLRADKRLEYGKVIEVLDILKNSGVRRVSVATEIKP
jgi:biopolymer transport protein ExbD